MITQVSRTTKWVNEFSFGMSKKQFWRQKGRFFVSFHMTFISLVFFSFSNHLFSFVFIHFRRLRVRARELPVSCPRYPLSHEDGPGNGDEAIFKNLIWQFERRKFFVLLWVFFIILCLYNFSWWKGCETRRETVGISFILFFCILLVHFFLMEVTFFTDVIDRCLPWKVDRWRGAKAENVDTYRYVVWWLWKC